jgi:hypothetical protein
MGPILITLLVVIDLMAITGVVLAIRARMREP